MTQQALPASHTPPAALDAEGNLILRQLSAEELEAGLEKWRARTYNPEWSRRQR